MGPYTIAAKPIGPYASQLESQWAEAFQRLGVEAKYVGGHLNSHDFRLHLGNVVLPVEVKPLVPNSSHLTRAVLRCLRAHLDPFLVIEGPPGGGCRFWFSGLGPRTGAPNVVLVRTPWQTGRSIDELLPEWERRFTETGR